MRAYIERLFRSFRSSTPVPYQYQELFKHLYLDIAWFGVLSGTTIAFLAVFATRQGASTQQIGMLSAVPALANLLFALPAGSWLRKRPLGRAVFWTSILNRVFYLLLIPLPLILLPEAQVWVIIATTLIMTIPGVGVTVGFNALFGEIVPVEWRGHVVGIRNAVVSIVTTIFTLISGVLLDLVIFPYGYQIVFTLGFIGAAMSSVHLYKLSKMAGLKIEVSNNKIPSGTPASTSRRLDREIRAIAQRGVQSLHLDAMRGPYARVMGLLFGWHLFQFMTIPIITPFVVNELELSDQLIGLAGALFNVTVFLGSLRLSRLSGRFSNHRLTGAGIMGLGIFPIITTLGTGGYLLANMIGGLAWAVAGGALFNYILENVPADNRPTYLAWYSLVSNAAILIGSMVGPAIAGQIGFVPALIIFGILRFLAGVAILRWG